MNKTNKSQLSNNNYIFRGESQFGFLPLLTGKQKTAGMSRAAKPFILTLDISEVFCYFILCYNLYCSEGYRFTTKQYPSYVLQGIHPSLKEIDTMSNYITYEERMEVENCLFNGKSFGEIAKELGKDRSTISREVRKHSLIERSGYGANGYNACVHRDVPFLIGLFSDLGSCFFGSSAPSSISFFLKSLRLNPLTKISNIIRMRTA